MTQTDDGVFDATLRAAQAGDGLAFSRLYEQFEPAVAGFVRSRRVTDADDVVNAIFLAVFTGLASFSGDEAGFRAWVFRIARNKIADWFRDLGRQRQRIEASEASSITGAPAPDHQDWVAGDAAVDELLSVLTENQREVLLLRVVADLTGPQTAEVLGKPLSAVRALQRRAIESLNREISSKAVSN